LAFYTASGVFPRNSVPSDGNIGTDFILHRKMATTDSSISVFSANAPFKFRVIDMWAVNHAAGGAADTVKLTDGTNDITDALDCNKSDKVVTRVGTLDDAYWEVAYNGTLTIVTASAAPVDVYIRCVPVS